MVFPWPWRQSQLCPRTRLFLVPAVDTNLTMTSSLSLRFVSNRPSIHRWEKDRFVDMMIKIEDKRELVLRNVFCQLTFVFLSSCLEMNLSTTTLTFKHPKAKELLSMALSLKVLESLVHGRIYLDFHDMPNIFCIPWTAISIFLVICL